jgi:hypothetical protein|eukprot:Stramenopile-MAST_4_protein_1520
MAAEEASDCGSTRVESQPTFSAIYPREGDFFSFCPLDLIDEVYNIVEGHLCDTFDDFERTLVRSAATLNLDYLRAISKSDDVSFESVVDSTSREVSFRTGLSLSSKLGLPLTLDDLAGADLQTCRLIRAAIDIAMEKASAVYDKNFDKFEMYVLKNVFRIPDGVLLAGHKHALEGVVDSSSTEENAVVFTDEDEKAIDDERHALTHSIIQGRRECKRSFRAKVSVDAEIEEFQRRMPLIQNATKSITSQNGSRPLQEVVEALLERTGAVSQLEENIKATAMKLKERGGKAVLMAGRKRRFSQIHDGAQHLQFQYEHSRQALGNVTAESAVELRKRLG